MNWQTHCLNEPAASNLAMQNVQEFISFFQASFRVDTRADGNTYFSRVVYGRREAMDYSS